MANLEDEIQRPTRDDDDQLSLFDDEPAWRDEWWGMPKFEMGDATPKHRVTLNFLTTEDLQEFAKLTGLRLTAKTDGAWYPPRGNFAGQFEYQGPPTDSRHPVCVLSKGRHDCQTTSRTLDRLGVLYRFFVEETEADQYREYLGESKVVSLPFHDLGQGGVPARNFIWDWCREREHTRHWTIDDNIVNFVRCHRNRRLNVRGGGFFRAMEDFVGRYGNIAMAGPHHLGFVPDSAPNLSPYLLDSRVYSCILLDTSLPYRWRGRYNEDTDLSLRLLKDGHCTLLFRALCMDKGGTAGSRGSRPMKGGNTDNVYNTDDHRLAFAQSLCDQHPDVVKVTWKFNRWHHEVDYSPFSGNKPHLRADVTRRMDNDEYGMSLVRLRGDPP